MRNQIHVERYDVDSYTLEVTEEDLGGGKKYREAWIGTGCVKVFMFGMEHTQCSWKEFKEIAEANALDYIDELQ